MSHMLSSIQHLKEEVAEPWRMALIQRAIDKGVTYTLKCVSTGGPEILRTRFADVERCFKVGQQMELPALVASYLWDKYCISCVGGSERHVSTMSAPFAKPCFEEVVDETRGDLGPDLELREGGAAVQADLIREVRKTVTRSGRASSDGPTDSELKDVVKNVPRPAGGTKI